METETNPQRGEVEQCLLLQKKVEKPASSRSKLLQSIGRSAARKYIQNHTVFPVDDCFTLKKEDNSFSTILYNEFQDGSVYRNEQSFAVLLTSQRSLWYTHMLQPSQRRLDL